MNLRGELTTWQETRKFNDIEFVKAVSEVLNISTSDEMTSLRFSLYPAIVCSLSAAGDLQNLKKLHECGADMSAPDYDRRSPLHLAVENGHEEIVQFMLSLGSSVHMKDMGQNTPLLTAVKHGYTKIIKLLKKAGAVFPSPFYGDLITK